MQSPWILGRAKSHRTDHSHGTAVIHDVRPVPREIVSREGASCPLKLQGLLQATLQRQYLDKDQSDHVSGRTKELGMPLAPALSPVKPKASNPGVEARSQDPFVPMSSPQVGGICSPASHLCSL